MFRLACITLTLIVAVAGANVGPTAARAQTNQNAGVEDGSGLVQTMFSCREIEEPTTRLECYDREVARVEQAAESKELVIADREQVQEARRGLFGFSLPKIRLFGGRDGEKAEDIDEIVAVIAKTGFARNGKLFFELEEGGRWMQTDNTPILGQVDGGDQVTIEKAALGSYKAKIGSRRAFRVKRID